jgi:hypothetical protein
MPSDGESNENNRQKEEASLQAFSRRVEQLRINHERFFMGIDRIPPNPERQTLERDLRNSPLMRSRNTALRFQFNNVRQRLLSYARYWNRIMRLIEEGKFRRERTSLANSGAPAGVPMEAEESGDRNRELYGKWQEAHSQSGTQSKATFESFAAKIEAQRQRQIQTKGWRDVDFDIRVEDGKVRLVGKPVRGDDGGR